MRINALNLIPAIVYTADKQPQVSNSYIIVQKTVKIRFPEIQTHFVKFMSEYVNENIQGNKIARKTQNLLP